MRCPFCAEDIADQAVLCRFCHATKKDGQWLAPASVPQATVPAAPSKAPEPDTPKGHSTIRISAFLFLLTAGFELFSIMQPAVIFGGMRGGAFAMLYHCVFIVLFGIVGMGLWLRARFGYNAVFTAAAVYGADRVQYILSAQTRAEEVKSAMSGIPNAASILPPELILKVQVAVSFAALLSIVGFAMYLYFRRAYFTRDE